MDTIRGLCIGVSAHQKLDHLQALVRLLGYESVAVFGDCFDEARPAPPVPPSPPRGCACRAGRRGCACAGGALRGRQAPLG